MPIVPPFWLIVPELLKLALAWYEKVRDVPVGTFNWLPAWPM